MYDIIYDYFITNIFNSLSLNSYEWTIGGVSTNLNVWLAHTCSIVCIIILVVILCLCVRWCFRMVTNAFKKV